MRILVVADIHGNWPALQAVTEPHDVCLCLGDLVDYCLEPTPCIDWARQHARFAVRGNHDHDAAQNVPHAGKTGFRYLTTVTAPLTRQRLLPEAVRYLASLPVTRMVTLDHLRIFLVHATPRDPLEEPAPANADFWAPRLESVDADIICVGHTHEAYTLQVGNKLVLNPGSVGLPRDGNPQAAYALITDGQVELKRVAYDVEAAIRPLQDSALPDAARQTLAHVLRTGLARPRAAGANSPAPAAGEGGSSSPELEIDWDHLESSAPEA
jgi:putative phosphoesterase